MDDLRFRSRGLVPESGIAVNEMPGAVDVLSVASKILADPARHAPQVACREIVAMSAALLDLVTERGRLLRETASGDEIAAVIVASADPIRMASEAAKLPPRRREAELAMARHLEERGLHDAADVMTRWIDVRDARCPQADPLCSEYGCIHRSARKERSSLHEET